MPDSCPAVDSAFRCDLAELQVIKGQAVVAKPFRRVLPCAAIGAVLYAQFAFLQPLPEGLVKAIVLRHGDRGAGRKIGLGGGLVHSASSEP